MKREAFIEKGVNELIYQREKCIQSYKQCVFLNTFHTPTKVINIFCVFEKNCVMK